MSTNASRMLIRADASVTMGMGHVMRCLALAQVWRARGGDTIFAMAQSTPALDNRLDEEGFEIVRLQANGGSPQDAAEISALARARNAAWIVVDGYHFGGDYQRSLRSANLAVLFLDDTGHCNHYCAELVLNQNIQANELTYACRDSGTKLLLGPNFAMLREEFRPWRDWRRDFTPLARKLLVLMGGSDPENFTMRVLHAIEGLEGLEVVVVAGGSNPHLSGLQDWAHRRGANVRVARDVRNMPELIAWADLAVSASGSTCWEMCALGLPAILVALAENQIPVGRELHRREIAIYLGCSREIRDDDVGSAVNSLVASNDRRRRMSDAGRELVDGRGADRVVDALSAGGPEPTDPVVSIE